MTPDEKLTQLIFDAIEEINTQLSEEQRLEKTLTTALYGDKGKLDSLGLVNFIVAVEQKLHDEFGFPVTLATERALSQQHSPFRTVHSLTNYITELLQEKDDGKRNNT